MLREIQLTSALVSSITLILVSLPLSAIVIITLGAGE
jgi:hypothetical protein